jgi:hypothetical protein
MAIATRQRVLLEAPLVARHVPVVYLPRPCARNRSPLDLDSSGELIEPARSMTERFLAALEPPAGPGLVGAPHHHDGQAWQPPALDVLIGEWGEVRDASAHRPDGTTPPL